MNVGKYVLKAIWEVKKLEFNKHQLRQITEEAISNAKQGNDEGDDSDGASSSEDESTTLLSNKKAMQQIQNTETDTSSPSSICKMQTQEDKSPAISQKGEVKTTSRKGKQSQASSGSPTFKQPLKPKSSNNNII